MIAPTPSTLCSSFWLLMTCAAWLSTIVPTLGSLARYGKLTLTTSTAANSTATPTPPPPSPTGHWASWLDRLVVSNAAGFTLFYVIAAVCSTLALLFALGVLPPVPAPPADVYTWWVVHSAALGTSKYEDGEAALVLALLTCQAWRRLSECLFVHRFSANTQHLLVTVMGSLYYVFAVLTPLVDSGIPAGVHGSVIPVLTSPAFYARPHISLGLLLFMVGWHKQSVCHRRLAALRPKTTKGDKVYVVPRGDWFELVSSPHYFAEMVMYLGFFVLRGGRLSQGLVLAWVVSNLGISGTRTHAWYLKRFDVYESLGRKAVIPWVW